MAARTIFFTAWILCLAGCRQAIEESRSEPATKDLHAQGEDRSLPVLINVPDFALTNQDGNDFGTDQLAGKVWIANFMFTRCPATCPRQTENLAALQKSLLDSNADPEVLLVSISVDPGHDTPAVLKAYAHAAAADTQRWHFLTGDRDDIWTLCQDGFKMAVSDAPEADSPIVHSSRFVLVDRQRQVRALFDGTDPQDLEHLRRDLRKLLSE